MEQIFRLAEKGKQLWTRDAARQVRESLGPLIAKLEVGDHLVIDAKGVEVFDFSFANELFGKVALAFAGEHAGRFVIVEGLSMYTRENLENALSGMKLVMLERTAGKLSLIGTVHPTDQATFNALARSKSGAAAAELADRLKTNVNAMNERLNKLIALGVIRREKAASAAGREQFQYYGPA